MANDTTAKTKADNRMGRTEIEQGDKAALDAAKKSYAQEIKDANAEEQLSPTQEFERKLLVDVSELNTNPYITRFEKLPKEEESKINYFFKGLTEQEFMDAQNQENTRTGRTQAGTPFKCIVTPSNGTLIITKDTLIRTDNRNEENGTIDATRRNADGSLSRLQMNKRMGMIVSSKNFHLTSDLTVEEQMMAEAAINSAADVNGATKKELEGKSPEERLAFLQTMKALGVNRNDKKSLEDMTDAELEDFKAEFDKETREKREGKRDHRSLMGSTTRGRTIKVNDTLSTTAVSVDIGIDEEQPETIRNLTSVNGKEKMEIYRRTADGKYVETTSFKMVRGKPSYKTYTFDQLTKRIGNNLINLEEVIAENAKMKEFEPQEIDAIARDTERAIERGKEQDRDEQEQFMPGMRRPDPRF